ALAGHQVDVLVGPAHRRVQPVGRVHAHREAADQAELQVVAARLVQKARGLCDDVGVRSLVAHRSQSYDDARSAMKKSTLSSIESSVRPVSCSMRARRWRSVFTWM